MRFSMQRVKTKKKKEWGSTSIAEVLSAKMDGKKCCTLVDAVQIDPASQHLATSAVTLFTLWIEIPAELPHFRWFVFISCPDHMQVTPDARDIGQRVTLGRHAAPHTGAGNLKFGRGSVTPSREKVCQLTAEPHSSGSEPGGDLVARLSDGSDFSKLCC